MDISPEAWTEDDLLSLIRNKVEERSDLEYKACGALHPRDDKKKSEISKDVSALANSDGGTIVYGMIEEKHLPKEVEGFDPSVITKEWLEQVILGNIRPRLQGVKINPVHLSTRAHGKYAYVVHVPQASTAHQASDKKYYKRFNFQNEPMEDYEIRDIMNRRTHPILIPQFEIGPIVTRTGNVEERKLYVTLRNEGNVRAQHVKLIFDTPRDLTGPGRAFLRGTGDQVEGLFGKVWSRHIFQKPDYVLFPHDELNLRDHAYWAEIRLNTDKFDRNDKTAVFLYWKVYADDMPPRAGELSLGDIPKAQ
ncbi:MAG: hypothetical protein A4E19_18040 [Nitrospira sp. SG-bin1]|nr:MAG: hypothetical protein A4E19_18040 [Nitrospira sp. SG-bin1]